MKFSILIPTYNRAEELSRTLRSLSSQRTSHTWEVIVVDNNSRDHTREAVAEIARSFPVEVRYLFEPEQGKPAALNTGIAESEAEVIAFTDDDHRFEPDWLEAAACGLDRFGCDYVGGKILPIWGGPQPAWLSTESGRHRAVIGMADYGAEPFEFGKSPAMGGNLAVRRECFARTGMWDNRLGRRGNTLLGQEQREWCLRAREAGLRGVYLPDMVVYHLVPQERLDKRYFRRWFYWHGISRAILYQQFGLDMESPEETRLDFAQVPHIAGVPRYLFRTALRYAMATGQAVARRDAAAAFDHELWLWFFAGVVKQLSGRGSRSTDDRGRKPAGEARPPRGTDKEAKSLS
ncbi:MAG TPA: glycosyltransferase [Blastocatellia bacterium]|nr:glycosyltransferase [Blastocatellia bacterium]